jgi:tRNA acetyltransferase TAN1
MGVRTGLDPRRVIEELRAMFEKDPLLLTETCKWVPVDLWTYSDMESMKNAVIRLRERITAGETWRMTVEERRYTRHHRIEVITALAGLIDEKVDLTRPDKILRIDIIGRHAALSVLTPADIFSVVLPRVTAPPAPTEQRGRATQDHETAAAGADESRIETSPSRGGAHAPTETALSHLAPGAGTSDLASPLPPLAQTSW